MEAQHKHRLSWWFGFDSRANPFAQFVLGFCLPQGFNHHSVTSSRPMIGEMMLRVLDAAIRVPVAAPRHKAMRARVTSLIHRYIEVLGASLLPYAPQALEAL
eukprot:scaffold182173_cov26-Prasinocladus_malaysianus.AAC.1